MPVLALAAQAARCTSLPARFETSGSGSNANIFNATGIPTANLGIGIRQVHAVEEHLSLKDLSADVKWLWEVVKLASGGEGKNG